MLSPGKMNWVPAFTSHKIVMLYLLFFLYGESLAMENSLKIGNAMNIFARYGFMGVSMKVAGKAQPWIFREPTVDVFEITDDDIISYSDQNVIFNGAFHMEFCDNVVQLLEAYFREFTIEQTNEPWKVFAASWSNEAIAKVFGLNVSYIEDDYCFVLLRLDRHKEHKKLNDDISNLKPLEHIQNLTDQLEDGDLPAVGNFVKKFGSHYIASYITGDSLYQVIVYHPPVYERLKKRLRRTGIASLGKPELQALFSPWYADHVGPIMSASGNSTIMDWAKSTLRSRLFISFPYSTLLKLYKNEKLLRELDKKLENLALLSIELKTLTPIFNDQTKKQWFIDVISNNMELWENNMRMVY